MWIPDWEESSSGAVILGSLEWATRTRAQIVGCTMNRPVRTRTRGGVGRAGEIPALTRLDIIHLQFGNAFLSTPFG